MNKYLLLILVGVSILLYSFHRSEVEPISFVTPRGWPNPTYDFRNNPLSEEGFQLGRKLFYDTKLSRDSSISCSSCHLQYTGFTHVDHSLSHGIEGRKGTRNSPVLINLAWNKSFHWDGGVNHLDAQPINPITHPAEMDNTLEAVLTYLNGQPQYRQAFYQVFGDSVANTQMVMKAISQFTVSLVSSNSKYDKYVRGEVEFNSQELNGLTLFRKHCVTCHTEPLFSTNRFKSNGLPIDSTLNDIGRMSITKRKKDRMLFRVPTLRNVQHAFPYMHDGRFKRLREVIDYYADDLDTSTPYLSKELRTKIELSANDKKDLISFLYTLTDKEFLYNKRYSFPR